MNGWISCDSHLCPDAFPPSITLPVFTIPNETSCPSCPKVICSGITYPPTACPDLYCPNITLPDVVRAVRSSEILLLDIDSTASDEW